MFSPENQIVLDYLCGFATVLRFVLAPEFH